MDGFIAEALKGQKANMHVAHDPNCGGNGKSGGSDVMGYHDAREIPNYWTYAQDFVLQDHMFEPNASWSLPEHLFMVSEWSAKCSNGERPDELRERAAEPRPGSQWKLRVDGPHLPDVQAKRQLEVLRRPGHAAGLRGRPGHVHGAAADGGHAGDLEPAAVVHDCEAGRAARQHPDDRQLLHGREERDTCRRCHGWCRTAR